MINTKYQNTERVSILLKQSTTNAFLCNKPTQFQLLSTCFSRWSHMMNMYRIILKRWILSLPLYIITLNWLITNVTGYRVGLVLFYSWGIHQSSRYNIWLCLKARRLFKLTHNSNQCFLLLLHVYYNHYISVSTRFTFTFLSQNRSFCSAGLLQVFDYIFVGWMRWDRNNLTICIPSRTRLINHTCLQNSCYIYMSVTHTNKAKQSL